MTLPHFFTMEGIDGAGTTTQLDILATWLGAEGYKVWRTCEPTSGPVGGLIRKVLSGEIRFESSALAYLFAADREEHLNGKDGIREHLDRGDIVICDRYVHSSLAYQSTGASPALPFALNAAFPLPELLLYFDIDHQVSLGRIGGRETIEIFETEDFQRDVAARYRTVVSMYRDSGTRLAWIDASRDRDAVAKAVREAVSPLLPGRKK